MTDMLHIMTVHVCDYLDETGRESVYVITWMMHVGKQCKHTILFTSTVRIDEVFTLKDNVLYLLFFIRYCDAHITFGSY